MRNPDLCHVSLRIGSFVFDQLESLTGHEAIGEPFRYTVLAAASLPLPRPSALLGVPATLTLTDEYGQRTIHGVAAEVETFATDKDRGEVRVTFRPRTHPLTLGRASRSFQDQSAIDVVEKIVTAECPLVRALSRSYPVVPYRVQREEDDWSFVVRTLEAEGVTFYYDHDDESLLVLTDDTRGSPTVSGLAVLPYHRDGLDASAEAVTSLARAAAVKTTTMARKSFSWRNPSLGLSVSSGKGRYEVYDAGGGGPADPAGLERVAADAKDAAAAAANGLAGEAATLRLYPGRTFTIAALDVDDGWFSGEWLITSIDISLAGRRHTFVTKFTAIAKDIPYRPAARAASLPKQGQTASWGGVQPGLSFGMVIADAGDEVLPDDAGRVRVQMHWDRDGVKDSKAGTWMRVAQRFNPGSMMFPRTGWFVATVNEEAGVDAPGVISRIHDGERPPEYALPGNKTRVVYKTATSPGGGSHNEIHFEDAKGREVVFWNASKDMNLLTKNDAAERVDNDAWHDVGVNQTVSCGQSYSEQVNHLQTVTIGANQKTQLGANRAKTVGANDTVTVGGNRNLKVGDAAALGVSKNRTLTVGAALVDVSLGQIATTSRNSIQMVGGAVVRLSAKNYTEDASIASAELVGAVKVETAGENRTIGVEERFIEMVGGGVVVDAGKRHIDSATEKSTWTIGGALSGATKEVTLEGYTSIELRCGASVVVLEPEQIRMEATSLQLDGAELEAVTGIIVHNG
jgi:type VI secretion system secreted protein VgrG